MYNSSMKRGFTIIEVSLFLAVSALLFVGIAAGTGINVARQRYNNAAQDYAEFLRRLYSEVENVENGREGVAKGRVGCTLSGSDIEQGENTNEVYGRTNCAVYGKIAIYNEEAMNSSSPTDKIMVYDIIGNIVDNDHQLSPSTKSTISALREVNAEYLAYVENSSAASTCSLALAGNLTFHTPEWGSYIETPEGKRFNGAVMIVRSPLDGTIHTLTLSLDNTRIRNIIDSGTSWNCGSVGSAISAAKSAHAYLEEYYENGSFNTTTDVDFCINSDDIFAYNGRRRDIRLKADGHNSSAVEVIELDNEEENACL